MLQSVQTGKQASNVSFSGISPNAKPRPFHKFLHNIPLISFLFACFGIAEAQVSPAFDPNCYFPKIGVQGEIDTIYGAKNFTYLGENMLNIGPSPGDSYGRMSCGLSSNPDSVYNFVFSTGPSFNLKKLNVLGYLNINPGSIVRRGHFRSSKYIDIIDGETGRNRPARIYWQDDQGNYDSSRYTSLWSSVIGKVYNDYQIMTPYTTHISSDSVEDIIYMAVIADTITNASNYLLYFKGGEQLHAQGKIALSDSTLDLHKVIPSEYSVAQGDFRGVGRNDLIANDRSRNMYYFKNDPPFSMASFVNALRFDTLYAQWQNPHSTNYGPGESMHVFNKSSNDSSCDYLPFFASDYDSRPDRQISEVRIFKGGKDFGSKRWTSESAAFVLHEPYYYDLNFRDVGFGLFSGIRDCGDMTGTGNKVIYIGGTLDGTFYGYEFFYVMGNAMDDKADMFIGPIPNQGGAGRSVDTLTVDNDNLQDIAMGESGFGLDNGGEYNGSIYVVHGSTKIPVRTNKVIASNLFDQEISVFPNPAQNGKCTIDLSQIDQQDIQITIWDLLGRKVYAQHVYAPFMRAFYPVVVNYLSSGTYVLDVTGKNFSKKIQLSVLK